ncbi:hypothetical protein L2X99_01750 [Microbacterium sp. KUDC0406]|uniref:hypothetical protein n=1 Tax=Microbacterium sp. KUDC0406 TaxID=2909588 RepID=UPI001F1A74A5|nr:hypothetical protein [Microbacterium sp. KUDC0406]UJP10451.1 hypothetical protein L2X99_01750 [Microbacterium sp. KUDC0406]
MPPASGPLRDQRARFEEWTRAILGTLGGADAAARAPFLMAAGEGLLLHRITVDPGAPVRPIVAAAVAGALRPGTASPADFRGQSATARAESP